MSTLEIYGWINQDDFGDSDDIIWIGERDKYERPLTEKIEDIAGKQVTVHYYICDKKCTLEEAQEQFLYYMYGGEAAAEFTPHYSEYTGYLYTDENFVVGGHDLLEEIRSHLGKYLLLLIEVHN